MNSRNILVSVLLVGLLGIPGVGNAEFDSSTAPVPPEQVAASGSKSHKKQQETLITFNGYYALANTSGGFFAIDTDVHSSANSAKPKSVVSLIVSLDGTTSQSVGFTGTFDGRRLRQQTTEGVAFDLTFTRRTRKLGPTATLSGTITLPGQSAVNCSGTTYNNPIPAEFWGGQTYYAPSTKKGGQPTAAAKIAANGTLYYDNGNAGGRLSRVPSYRYNMDMYYFEFTDRSGDTATFIMGTAGQSGFAANNMIVKDEEPVSQRQLVTIPGAKAPKTGNWYPEFHLSQGPKGVAVGGDVTLADFSAYYPLKAKKSPKAFVAIEGVNLDLVPGIESVVPGSSPGALYRALITVSWDGVTSKNWYFDTSKGMTFDGRTLRMPKQGVRLTLEREYDPESGGLFSLNGRIKKRQVTGTSMFNPVPVSAFTGTMKDTSGQHELTVDADGVVVFDGEEIANYEYVPLMYILAGPVPGTTQTPQPVTMVSFGHAGTSGISAIVTTNYGQPNAKIVNVYSIAPTS